jgi:hypothetical protein
VGIPGGVDDGTTWSLLVAMLIGRVCCAAAAAAAEPGPHILFDDGARVHMEWGESPKDPSAGLSIGLPPKC